MIPWSGPIFVHSDIGRGLLVAKRAGAKINAEQVQRSLLGYLARFTEAGEAGLVFPAFNYDYGKTRLFDIDNDPVQVGALPEWVRRCPEFRRSEVPFFSFLSGVDLRLDKEKTINPFGKSSGFQWLVDHDAMLLLFGVGLNTLTFIHYVEELCGKPLYRYDKRFPGKITQKGQTRHCEFTMHVRPMGVHMDYDWHRLELDLVKADILQASEYAVDVKWGRARAILEFWGNRIADNPLYLLDQESRNYFSLATDGRKNRLKMESYENG